MKFIKFMLRFLFIAVVIQLSTTVFGQFAVSKSTTILSPNMVLNDEWTVPAVMKLDGDDVIHFSFDELSHTYKRYLCRVVHCNSDYSPSELSEIEYMDGFNNFPIESWENSVNTTTLYTHYEFTIPNDNIRLLVSGNYRVEIYDEEDSENKPVVIFDFAVIVPEVGINAWVSGDTDSSYNTTEQQLFFALNYSKSNVVSPASEFIPVVYQNRRKESVVTGITPTHVTGNEVQYFHNEKLIFPAGNEFRRFELTDPNAPGMGVEEVIYHESAYHALLYMDKPRHSYSNWRDENGRLYANTLEGRGSFIEADYVNVHFALAMPFRKGGNFYLQGDFGDLLSADNRLEYDAQEGYYFISKLLKLGVCNYNYVWIPDEGIAGRSNCVEGDFYNTENEYLIYIYHREFGARYDRLVGVHSVNSNK